MSIQTFVEQIATGAALGSVFLANPVAGAIVGGCSSLTERVVNFVSRKLQSYLPRSQFISSFAPLIRRCSPLVGGTLISKMALQKLGFAALPFATSFTFACSIQMVHEIASTSLSYGNNLKWVAASALAGALIGWAFVILTPMSCALIGASVTATAILINDFVMDELASMAAGIIIGTLLCKSIFVLPLSSALLLGIMSPFGGSCIQGITGRIFK